MTDRERVVINCQPPAFTKETGIGCINYFNQINSKEDLINCLNTLISEIRAEKISNIRIEADYIKCAFGDIKGLL